MTVAVTATAQSYSNDVTLLTENSDAVTLCSSGIDTKKKEALDMALKSAFHTLFFVGMEGVNGGKPLITNPNKIYTDNFMHTRYLYFVRSHEELSCDRLPNKNYKSTVRLVVPLQQLIKELTTAGLMGKPLENITMEETQEEIALPSIMVVPYKKEGVTYKEVLANDFDRRMAVGKVQDGFNRKGVTTVDFEAKLNASMRSMEFQANDADSNDKQLLQNSGADVYVIVDLQKEIAAQGNRVALSMKAYETASGNVLASRQGWTNRFKTSALDRLCVLAVNDLLDGFLKDISMNFARKVTKGNSIVLKVSVGGGSLMSMSSQVGPNNYTLSTVIRQWVRKNALGGRYHLQGIVDEAMIFDNVQIPAKDADGLPLDAAQFGENLMFYLNEEVTVQCSNKIDGNTIYITIN